MDLGDPEADDVSDEDIFAALDALEDPATVEPDPSLGRPFP